MRIANALLGTDSSCSPANTDCQAAAAEIAAQLRRRLRQASASDPNVSPPPRSRAGCGRRRCAHVAARLRSEEGRHFFDAWAALRDPDSARQRRELQRDPAQTAPAIFNPARALFRQRTRNLPRPAPR